MVSSCWCRNEKVASVLVFFFLSPGDPDSVAGEFGQNSLYKMLGYFSLIGLLRLHSLLGDYYQALKVLENIDFNKKVSYTCIKNMCKETTLKINFLICIFLIPFSYMVFSTTLLQNIKSSGGKLDHERKRWSCSMTTIKQRKRSSVLFNSAKNVLKAEWKLYNVFNTVKWEYMDKLLLAYFPATEPLLACAHLPDDNFLLCRLCLFDDAALSGCHPHFLQHTAVYPAHKADVPKQNSALWSGDSAGVFFLCFM